ncbi:MAG: LysR family transcriptional regulator [Myxococcales bacterium]|nr:LysR family transcriptional regulator [Myxococcales bacterium]
MPINRSPMDFELLPSALVFEAVVRAGSFRGAAEELQLSPSTVSARVASLEESLGIRLIHRTTRTVTLTEAGRTLRDEMSSILPTWRRAEDRARAHAEEPQGVLVVTAPDAFMAGHIVPVAVDFQRRHTATRFVFRTTLSTLSMLDEGIDVAVRAGPLPPSELGARELWRGVHVAVASPSFTADKRAEHPSELMSLPTLDVVGRRPLTAWHNDN